MVAGRQAMKRRAPSQTKEFDVAAWFVRLDAYGDVPFMPEGREQPPMPEDKDLFDDDEPVAERAPEGKK
jgi:hypothetical protein